MRVLKSPTAWWSINGDKVARIPSDIVPLERTDIPSSIFHSLEKSMNIGAIETDAYHLTILTSTRCNLACHYCFQNENIPVSGQVPTRIPGSTVSESTIDKIFNFAARQMRFYEKSYLDLMLFGGEPLLASGECLDILHRASDVGLSGADMISNGVLLSKSLAIKLSSAGLDKIQITLDGDKVSHDGIRFTKGRRGTYDQIIENVAAVCDYTDITVSLRVNITSSSAASIGSLIDDLEEKLSPEKVRIGFSLVHDPGIGFSGVAEKNNILAQHLVDGYIRLAKAGFDVPLPRGTQSCITCGKVGGGSGAVINADGTLYSCWESAGKKGWEVGDIERGYLTEETVSSRWVACGYSSSDVRENDDIEGFEDLVDGRLLDRMYDEDLLGKATRFG